MIYINLKRVMRLRGVDNHYKMLVKLGFAPVTAKNFIEGAVWRINFEHLEQLCVALNCTPNDLLEWQPDAGQNLSETHSLNALQRKSDKDLSKLIGEIPMEKFEQILDILKTK